MKRLNKKANTIDMKKKHLIHSDSNNNNDSTKKIKQYSHSSVEHIPSTSSEIHDHHRNCELCGEIISCDTCSSTIHLFCMNSSLSKEDLAKNAQFCENCRRISKRQNDFINQDKQQKLILPFSFDPKKNLYTNGLKKTQSALEQIKVPTGMFQTLTRRKSFIEL